MRMSCDSRAVGWSLLESCARSSKSKSARAADFGACALCETTANTSGCADLSARTCVSTLELSSSSSSKWHLWVTTSNALADTLSRENQAALSAMWLLGSPKCVCVCVVRVASGAIAVTRGRERTSAHVERHDTGKSSRVPARAHAAKIRSQRTRLVRVRAHGRAPDVRSGTRRARARPTSTSASS